MLLPAIALLLSERLTATVAGAQSPWVDFSPKGAGFSIQMPAEPRPHGKKPGRFFASTGDNSFIVESEPLEGAMKDVVQSGNRRGIDQILASLRDETVKAMGGRVLDSNMKDFNGFPSVFFTFETAVGGQQASGTERIVLADDRQFSVVALGAKGSMKKEDVERFFTSFKLTGAPAPPEADAAASASDGAFRRVPYLDVVCHKMPAVPVAFLVPSDYVSRPAGSGVEGGCLWGTKDDLDRATRVPDEGDFSELSRGVFRARVSTNIVCTPAGNFDAMDGAGEAGIRTQLEATGASLVKWKKETLGGLPALEIVADAPGAGRVYMLYLGNTRFSSNCILLNYYQPKKRTAADDEIWARFVAGIQRAAKP